MDLQTLKNVQVCSNVDISTVQRMLNVHGSSDSISNILQLIIYSLLLMGNKTIDYKLSY